MLIFANLTQQFVNRVNQSVLIRNFYYAYKMCSILIPRCSKFMYAEQTSDIKWSEAPISIHCLTAGQRLKSENPYGVLKEP